MTTDFVKQTLRENMSRALVPHVADGLWSIYDNARTACERNGQIDQILRTFQNLLTRVPDWKEDTLKQEVERITVSSKCDYLEDLLLGVFVSYIRAFATLQQSDKLRVDIQFTPPSIQVFVHTLYKHAARHAWSNAYLFKTVGVPSEQQARNRRDIETSIATCMNDVIDSFIPWKRVSQAYFRPSDAAAPEAPAASVKFGENETHEFESEDEDESPLPPIKVGDEIKLDDSEFETQSDSESVHLEEPKESVALNL
jgi:Family of unknown function (DUF5764)